MIGDDTHERKNAVLCGNGIERKKKDHVTLNEGFNFDALDLAHNGSSNFTRRKSRDVIFESAYYTR